METIQQQKAALRRRLAAREQAMTRRERELSDRAIIYHVTQTEEYRRARTVFAFVGCGREIGTRALLEQILSEGKELCVPLCTGPGHMECRRVRDLSVLRPGSYGIPEPPPEAPAAVPEDIDLAIVPCVGAAAVGRRLGRGGGAVRRAGRADGSRAAVYRLRPAAVPGKAPVPGYSPGGPRHLRSRRDYGKGAALGRRIRHQSRTGLHRCGSVLY